MLWYKSWLDTWVRFLGGLVLLIGSAFAIVATYPQVMKLLAAAPQLRLGGALGQAVAEGVALASTYRGYIWSQWFLKNLPQLWCLCAVLLGSGGVVTQAARG